MFHIDYLFRIFDIRYIQIEYVGSLKGVSNTSIYTIPVIADSKNECHPCAFQ